MATHIRNLQGVLDSLLAVPRGYVELSQITVEPSSGSGNFAVVLAPPGARATDVTVDLMSQRYGGPGEDAVLATLRANTECNLDEQPLVIAHLSQLCQVTAIYRNFSCTTGSDTWRDIDTEVRTGAGLCVEVFIRLPTDAPQGAAVALRSVRVAGRVLEIALPTPSVIVYSGPQDLAPDQAALLQSWVGRWNRPESWIEVFRASRDSFTADAFHAHCDDKRHLLVLIREKANGWLFGGYTAVGWLLEHKQLGAPRYADPDAFLFSLSNPAGLPEKLESLNTGKEMTYQEDYLATFGIGAAMGIANRADVNASSWTNLPYGFKAPAPAMPGASYPMSQDLSTGWCISELVVFQVPAGVCESALPPSQPSPAQTWLQRWWK